jgi:SulP family sulfate permease
VPPQVPYSTVAERFNLTARSRIVSWGVRSVNQVAGDVSMIVPADKGTMSGAGTVSNSEYGGLRYRPGGLVRFASRPAEIIREYRSAYVFPDALAGVTVAAVAIPQAIAYASIAELPAHCGLYAAAIGAIVGALWGSSRFLATGPVNASSLLVLPVLLAVAVPDTPQFLLAAGLVAVLAGLLRIALALMHFGALVTLASRSVLIGFTAGAAVHIGVGQIKHLLGLDVPATPELYRAIGALIARAGETNEICVILGVSTMALVVGLGWLGPRVPAALVAIVVAGLAAGILGLTNQGVPVVGAVSRSLPPPTWVSTGLLPDLQMVRGVIVGTMAVAALGLIEAVAASQTLARRSGDRLDNNQEFFGQGLANVVAGLFSGYPVSGSFTRSALARQSGARTNLTGVFTGAAVLGGMLIFAPWAGLIPKPAIAGVLLVIAWRMVDRKGIRRTLRTSRTETAVMIVTFCATMVLPLDFAVLSGVVFSLALFVMRSSLGSINSVVPDSDYRHFVSDPNRPACPQLGLIEIRGPLFFGAVHHIEEELRRNQETHPGQNNIVLRLHGVDMCDLTGIEMLESTIKWYRGLGGDVYVVGARGQVMKMMEDSGFLEQTLGRDHVLDRERAIEYLFDNVLDPAICSYECGVRVFAECQAVEKHPYDAQFPPAPRVPIPHDRFLPLDRFQELAGDADTPIFDIREPVEYERGHVPRAVSLPLRLLPERWHDLPEDRTVLLVCRSGRRSWRALRMLEDFGLSKVYALRGGILAWRAAGLPVTAAEGEKSE